MFTALTDAIDFADLITGVGVGMVALIGYSIWKSGALQLWTLSKMPRRG